MRFDRFAAESGVRRRLVAAVTGLTALTVVWGGVAWADPGQDTVAKLNELSRQAEHLTATMQSVQQDLDRKIQLQKEADQRYAEAVAALDIANAQLAVHQAAVDRVAAAVYVRGRSDSLGAILAAASPKALIDDLAVQRVMTTQMSEQVSVFRRAQLEAQTTEAAAAEYAAGAVAATAEAAALRDDLLRKRSELRTQVALVRASYAMLPHAQQAGFNAPSAAVTAALGLAPPVPLVGMNGLVPNARALVQYIVATYPGVQSIGGVRADPLPDHPSGRAIDIMIGSDMALGDAINADIQNQAGRFGVVYTMWRVANHFNHVHITVS